MFWETGAPIILKEVELKFEWYSVLLVHRISEEDITTYLKTVKTLETIMLELRSQTGADNFIAVVNHMPKDELMLAEERHLYNLKYLEKYKLFVRFDKMSPRA